MEISSRLDGSILIVSLTGSVDALTGPEASNFVSSQIEHGHTKLVLDLSGVTFMSSAGVRMLLVAAKSARQVGGDVRASALPRNISRVLEIGGVSDIIQTFEDVQTAVASYSA